MPVATSAASCDSAILRASACTSIVRSGSRHSSASGTTPPRANVYTASSVTIAVIFCAASVVAAVSAAARSAYGPTRTLNGLSFAAVAFAPIFFAASAASADVVYGPTFSVKRCFDDAVDVIDAPRSIVALSAASAGSADASSRRPAQPRSTPERTRASAAGSPASA